MTDFDTEKPPVARWGPPATPGSASRIPELTIGPDIVLDFTGNPAAAEPFFEWLRTGAAWAAFGGWFDGVG